MGDLELGCDYGWSDSESNDNSDASALTVSISTAPYLHLKWFVEQQLAVLVELLTDAEPVSPLL